MSCPRELLHRDATSLDEAQRLRLDDHLATCATCRGDRARLRRVRELGTSLTVPAFDARRAIARALIEGAPRRTPVRTLRWVWPLAAAVVVIAAVFVALPVKETLAPRIVARPRAAVVDNLVVGPATVKRPAMQVALAAATRARLTDRTVLLEVGHVEIEASGEVTRVITERFEIVLTDGAVGVDAEGVRVTRGTARVVDRAGAVLAQLESGSEWQPGFVEMPAEAVDRKPRPKRAELVQARAQLAAGNTADAERTAEAVLARTPSRNDEAEARMFLADLAQATGKLDVAVSRYEAVATKFADLPTAESALYAAARIEMRRGQTAAAYALFDRYLARYPNGRYANDVRNLRRPE